MSSQRPTSVQNQSRSKLTLILIVALSAMTLAACSGGGGSSPTAAKASCYAGCSGDITQPLSQPEINVWLDKARAEVKAQIDSGEIRLNKQMDWSDPRIEWRACPFAVDNAKHFGNVCAAGLTKAFENKIVVSTFDLDRRGPLVYWEFRNLLWIRAGQEWRTI